MTRRSRRTKGTAPADEQVRWERRLLCELYLGRRVAVCVEWAGVTEQRQGVLHAVDGQAVTLREGDAPGAPRWLHLPLRAIGSVRQIAEEQHSL